MLVIRSILGIGVDYTIEKVTDMNAIIDAGMLRLSALAVDGAIVVEGAVPSAAEIRSLLPWQTNRAFHSYFSHCEIPLPGCRSR